jgi:hypothetical protein
VDYIADDLGRLENFESTRLTMLSDLQKQLDSEYGKGGYELKACTIYLGFPAMKVDEKIRFAHFPAKSQTEHNPYDPVDPKQPEGESWYGFAYEVKDAGNSYFIVRKHEDMKYAFDSMGEGEVVLDYLCGHGAPNGGLAYSNCVSELYQCEPGEGVQYVTTTRFYGRNYRSQMSGRLGADSCVLVSGCYSKSFLDNYMLGVPDDEGGDDLQALPFSYWETDGMAMRGSDGGMYPEKNRRYRKHGSSKYDPVVDRWVHKDAK